MIREVLYETRITATAGIGTNLQSLLCLHSRDRRTPYTQPEAKHEKGIEEDVQDGAEDDGEHGGFGFALNVEKRIEGHRHHDKRRAKQVAGKVLPREGKRLFRRPAKTKQRLQVRADSRNQHYRKESQHRATGSQNPLRLLLLSRAHGNRGKRRSPASDNHGESGDQGDQRRADADSREGTGADSGNMADIHSVDDTVQQVDQLGHHGRKRHPKDQRQDGFGQKTSIQGILRHGMIIGPSGFLCLLMIGEKRYSRCR